MFSFDCCTCQDAEVWRHNLSPEENCVSCPLGPNAIAVFFIALSLLVYSFTSAVWSVFQFFIFWANLFNSEYLLHTPHLINCLLKVFQRFPSPAFYLRVLTVPPLQKTVVLGHYLMFCQPVLSFLDNFNRFFPKCIHSSPYSRFCSKHFPEATHL